MKAIIIAAIICGTILVLAAFFLLVCAMATRTQKQVTKTANDVFKRVGKAFDEDDG